MSGRIVPADTRAHHCDTPRQGAYADLWQCDECGRWWRCYSTFRCASWARRPNWWGAVIASHRRRKAQRSQRREAKRRVA